MGQREKPHLQNAPVATVLAEDQLGKRTRQPFALGAGDVDDVEAVKVLGLVPETAAVLVHLVDQQLIAVDVGAELAGGFDQRIVQLERVKGTDGVLVIA